MVMRYQPQGLLRVDQGHPLAAGLRLAMLPGVNRAFDVAGMRSATPSGMKQVGSSSGMAAGFGTALGAGTADKIVTGLTGAFPVAGRSYFFRARRNGAGGGNLGRLFDKTNGSTGQMLYWSTSSGLVISFYAGGAEQTAPINGSTTACAVGVDFDVLVVHSQVGSNSGFKAYLNGVLAISSGLTATFNDAATTPITIGNRASDNARNWDGLIECAYVWDRILSDSEAAALSANRYQLFAIPYEDDELVTSAGGGATDTPVSPAALALSLAGYAPSVVQTANQSAAPAAGSLAIAGYAPLIAQGVTVNVGPGAGSLAVTGYPPTVTQGAALGLMPAPAALAVSGYAPTVGQTANVSLAPAPAGLIVTGYAPSVSIVAPQPVAVPLLLSTLAITGYAPTIYQGAAQQPAIDGGGSGSVREVRAFADLLNKAHAKPSRSQKKARRRQLETEALELLPDLPEIEKLAPVAARIVYEQEARTLAPMYADRPISAPSPVFDAHAALRELINRLLEEALEAKNVAEDEENDVELLLFGT